MSAKNGIRGSREGVHAYRARDDRSQHGRCCEADASVHGVCEDRTSRVSEAGIAAAAGLIFSAGIHWATSMDIDATGLRSSRGCTTVGPEAVKASAVVAMASICVAWLLGAIAIARTDVCRPRTEISLRISIMKILSFLFQKFVRPSVRHSHRTIDAHHGAGAADDGGRVPTEGVLLGVRLWYGFYGIVLESEEAFAGNSPDPERAHKKRQRNQDLCIFLIFHACAHYFR